MSGKTLYDDKLWDAHRVREEEDGTTLLYIDRHLVHEVTSPQAFEGLRLAGRSPWRTDAVLAVPDHNVPTTDRSRGVAGIADPVSRIQVETLDRNCEDFGINEFRMADPRHGDCACCRPGAGRYPAGYDGGLRRFAHFNPRGFTVRWLSASAPPKSNTYSQPSA